jgi:hypothetical protein
MESGDGAGRSPPAVRESNKKSKEARKSHMHVVENGVEVVVVVVATDPWCV